MPVPYADLQELHQSSPMIELFTLDCTPLGGTVYRFTNEASPTGGPLVFGGNSFIPLPVKTEGWDFTSTGAPPKPKLTVSNVNTVLLADTIALGDLVGARLTRVRTFAKYLDAATFIRRNLLSRTQEIGNAAWSKVSIGWTSDAATAPDGTATADRISEANVTPTSPYFYATQTVSAGASTTFTFSCYFKAAERTFANLRFDDAAGVNTVTVGVNLATGVLGPIYTAGTASNASATIIDCTNGWYRVALTCTWASMTNVRVFVRPAIGTNNTTDLGYAGNTANGILVWGAQLEAGSVLTPYQPVSSSIQPFADSSKFIGPEVYIVEQKLGHNREFIQWQLTSILDRFGTLLPRRQVLKDKGFDGVARTRVIG